MPKPSDKRKEAYKRWVMKFYVEIWEAKFTPTPDPPSRLIGEFVKDNISDERLKYFKETTEAWIKYLRVEARTGKRIMLPIAANWYKDMRYEDPIPSAMEAKSQAELGKCITCKEREIIGEKFLYCDICLPVR